MKNLPILIKEPNKKYFIGVDVSLHDKSETFAYTIALNEDEIIKIVDSNVITNNNVYQNNRPSDHYINQLESHYNTKTIKGK